MRTTRMTRFWVRRFVPAVLLFASLALALAAATASAYDPAAKIQFAGDGHLVYSSTVPGLVTGVKVTLKYDCVPPSPGSITVNITEEDNDGNFADGGTFLTATCDDRGHDVTVTVDGPFFKGIAVGNATITNGNGVAFGTVNQEVNIKN